MLKRFIIIGSILLIAGTLFLAHSIVDTMIENRENETSKIILKIVNEQANSGLLLPNIMVVNGDKPLTKVLKDSISKRVSTFLIKKYLKKENPNGINYTPFFVYPDSVINKNNYIITREQLDQLRNHIAFLTLEVNKAVEESKTEISRETSRINTLVVIWIGIVGFLGIFIPILINLNAFNDLRIIKNDANSAQQNASAALGEATKARENSELALSASEVAGAAADAAVLSAQTANLSVEKSLEESIKAIDEANKALIDSSKAIDNAQLAQADATLAINKTLRIDKLLVVLNDVSKIKDIDATFLLYSNNPLQTLKEYLVEIQLNLGNSTEIYDEMIIRDIFRQLSLRLHLISFYDFVGATNLDLLNAFASELVDLINEPMTEESFRSALQLFDSLNNNLVFADA